jgi:hypothetical protein
VSSPIASGSSGRNLSSEELRKKKIGDLIAMLKTDLSSDDRERVLSQLADISENNRLSSPAGASGNWMSSHDLLHFSKMASSLKIVLSSDDWDKILSQHSTISKDDRASSPVGASGNWMSSNDLTKLSGGLPSSTPVGISGNWVTSTSSYSGRGVPWLKVIILLGAIIGTGWLVIHFFFR